jgi:predicted  nucleic acid-binding Zn-ribbon protein
MADDTNDDAVDTLSATEIAEAPMEAEAPNDVQFASDEEASTNQVEEELNNFRELIATAAAEIQQQASEFHALVNDSRQADKETKEAVATLQTTLSSAQNLLEDITSTVSQANDLPNQLSQLKDEVTQIHEEAAKANIGIEAANTEIRATHTEIKTAYTEIEQLRSDVTTNADAVAQHEQGARTSSNAAVAHNEAAVKATASAAKSQADALVALTQVQGYLNQAQLDQQEVSNAFTSATTELAETKRLRVSTSQVLSAVEQDKATAEGALEQVAVHEKSMNEASERVKVLEQDINKTNDELAVCRKQFGDLKKEIEGLLPGATSAGLSSAFRNQKESYNAPKLLYVGLLVLSALAVALIPHYISDDEWTTKLTNPWQIILAHWLQKSPLEAPMFLLLYFAFRAFTTADKLQQDYAYKERIATTFEGFKAQFANIETPPGTESLLSVLCAKVLTIIGQHPARFYDAKHIEDAPSPAQAVRTVQGMFIEPKNDVNSNTEIAEANPPVPIAATGSGQIVK